MQSVSQLDVLDAGQLEETPFDEARSEIEVPVGHAVQRASEQSAGMPEAEQRANRLRQPVFERVRGHRAVLRGGASQVELQHLLDQRHGQVEKILAANVART